MKVTAIHVLCMSSLRCRISTDYVVSTFVDGFTVQSLGRTNTIATVSRDSTLDNHSRRSCSVSSAGKRRRRRIAVLSSTTSTAEEEETTSASSLGTNGDASILYTADTLDGRLLCAAQCAYDVSNRCYFRGVGFKAGTVAKRITRGNINSVLIGQTVDGIVISFRGTKENSPLDWLQNAALFLSNVDILPEKVKLHTGFYRAVKALWKPLTATLREFIDVYYEEQRQLLQSEITTTTTSPNTDEVPMEDSTTTTTNNNNNDEIENQDIPPPKIYLTGHSKGGALASIAAIMLRQSPTLPDPTYVCTYASAKPGNTEFRDYYNKQVNQTSYEAYLDIIPFLPPAKNMMSKLDDDMSEMVDRYVYICNFHQYNFIFKIIITFCLTINIYSSF